MISFPSAWQFFPSCDPGLLHKGVLWVSRLMLYDALHLEILILKVWMNSQGSLNLCNRCEVKHYSVCSCAVMKGCERCRQRLQEREYWQSLPGCSKAHLILSGLASCSILAFCVHQFVVVSQSAPSCATQTRFRTQVLALTPRHALSIAVTSLLLSRFALSSFSHRSIWSDPEAQESCGGWAWDA